jgi:hypothetical protein
VRKLISLLDSADERIALLAANSLLDRGLGRPKEQPDDPPPPPPDVELDTDQLTTGEMREFLRIVEKGRPVRARAAAVANEAEDDEPLP